jgi:hypothetical protein
MGDNDLYPLHWPGVNALATRAMQEILATTRIFHYRVPCPRRSRRATLHPGSNCRGSHSRSFPLFRTDSSQYQDFIIQVHVWHHGLGVRALNAIPKGMVLGVYAGIMKYHHDLHDDSLTQGYATCLHWPATENEGDRTKEVWTDGGVSGNVSSVPKQRSWAHQRLQWTRFVVHGLIYTVMNLTHIQPRTIHASRTSGLSASRRFVALPPLRSRQSAPWKRTTGLS